MTPNSFNVNSPDINSVDTWGLKAIVHDVFAPKKRARKIQIPCRHGTYNMGAGYYDDRILEVECQLTKRLAKAGFREIVYILSKKNNLFFWDEPDKFYRAELYESVNVDVFPREFGRNFTLPFTCEPFAYREAEPKVLSSGTNVIEYGGTIETPSLIVLKNNNSFSISNVQVVLTRRR